jgi:hypothetical protein
VTNMVAKNNTPNAEIPILEAEVTHPSQVRKTPSTLKASISRFRGSPEKEHRMRQRRD